ncbi:U1 small nuclear ribonucleoprotein C-like [Teleopsis dalmanni]|uniref:U1 small nuclear ribonucleoprotein C-like n=1 Tax=Teleopsis dalmanni TaxID=139649 RepID=UPI0018CD549D|nr:U1 small nuclear ribonucleoprotein C-like [Teleopsis dalmanni]XP_037956251.1 U1 small nuclear ribonucleoprotein C-like [Teleopsis dalmanni]
MPKYYCDYCDTYLTHDSPSVRKTHCTGRKHRDNVKFYYQKWMEEQAQFLIDATTAAFKAGKITQNPFAPGVPPGVAKPPGVSIPPPNMAAPPRPGLPAPGMPPMMLPPMMGMRPPPMMGPMGLMGPPPPLGVRPPMLNGPPPK